MSAALPPLSPIEIRVLGVLVEKERTVPDTYPLSLNALVAGCNQKSSRDPILQVGEAEVLAALENLRRLSLIIESSGSRVMRYSQNVKRVLGIPSESVALLATLALRGPQTAGELRINCERLHRFSDISAVEGFLRELAQREAGALVTELSRRPGERELRWAQLLGGPMQPDDEAVRAVEAGMAPTHRVEAHAAPMRDGEAADAQAADLAVLRATVARLENDVAELRASVMQLRDALGMRATPGHTPTDS